MVTSSICDPGLTDSKVLKGKVGNRDTLQNGPISENKPSRACALGFNFSRYWAMIYRLVTKTPSYDAYFPFLIIWTIFGGQIYWFLQPSSGTILR